MLRRREVIIWSTLALIIVWPLTLWGADREIQEPKTPIARLEVQPARIDWLPQVDDERLVLTVAGPGDLYIHQEFRRPQDPFLKITSPQDEGLPDGNYSYELRIVPHAALETMAQEQRIGVESIIGSLPRTKNIPESQPVQWGFFSIQEGAFVASSEQHDQLPDVTKHRVTGIASPDQVINDNLIVIGQACIGPACSAGLPGYDVVIKDTTPSIRLVDTTICCSNDDDWVIHTNFGGADNFVILNENTTGTDTKPFIIGGGAPDNALFVASSGNLGLGTATPASQLHVFGTDAASRNKILVENAGSQNFRELLEIRNNGGAFFILKDTSLPQRWSEGTLGSSLVLDEQAHSGVEYVFTNTGNLTIAGTLTQGSSRDLKTDLASLDPKDVLARVSTLPVSLWSYKNENAVRHVGPMAEDFHQAFGLGEDDKHIAPGDQAGVALLAVQGLNQMLQDKAQEMATLQRENGDLAKRVEALEALLSSLMAKQGAAAQAEPAP